MINFPAVSDDPHAYLLAGRSQNLEIAIVRVNDDFRLSANWVAVAPLFGAGHSGKQRNHRKKHKAAHTSPPILPRIRELGQESSLGNGKSSRNATVQRGIEEVLKGEGKARTLDFQAGS